MKLNTRRVIEKEFEGRIDSQLLKTSQECRALATLKYIFPNQFNPVMLAEAPDLQDQEKNIGVEVTVAVKKNDMKATSAFCEYKKTDDKKRKELLLKKIDESSSNVTTICNGIEVMISSGSLNEEAIYKEALRRKIEKSEKYKQVVKQLFLVVIFPEIPSRETEACLEQWTMDVITEREFDGVYVISERFFMHIDLLVEKVTKYNIEKEENELIRKIGRMTAEGEIKFSCEEWN